MYCIKCGVKLADTEKKCPLCGTVVYHPEFPPQNAKELYPSRKMPASASGRTFICGAVLILFMIPFLITLFSDILPDGTLDWFGYAAGAIVLLYLIFALPMWFRNPNPVIFVSGDFAACAVYLFYINFITGGSWFWSFAFPVVLGLAVIVCTLTALVRYLRKGKLYVVGGSVMAFGAWIFLIEVLMDRTFALTFIGWSLYPFVSLFFMGGLLIYLAMNRAAREKIERKIFL